MTRSRTAHVKDGLLDFADDVREAVAPRVESAAHTVAEKAGPALERGREAAVARGSQLGSAIADNAGPALERGRAAAAARGSVLGEALAERIPDDVVDRLPDALAQRLPKKKRRGRKALLLGLVAAAVGAVVVGLRRQSAPAPYQQYTAPATPAPTTRPAADAPQEPTA